jgi:hypothetical protein
LSLPEPISPESVSSLTAGLNRPKEKARLTLEQADTKPSVADIAAAPVNNVWRTIRNYVLWSYDRGSLHYDVMVTLILAFLFLSPYYINFNDKPIERAPHPTGVVVLPDGQAGFICQIEASAVTGKDDDTVRQQLLRVIEPITGEVAINRYEMMRDSSGKVTAYKVWVERP